MLIQTASLIVSTKAMDFEAYLKRINYSGPVTADAQTLRALQVAHLRSVPFENLSIHAGEPIVLSDAALFKKIVEQRRGGFCYELNGLFSSLLQALGFEVTKLAAGVAKNSISNHSDPNAEDFGPVFDHMALMVNLDQRWLVDVGFGDSFLEPLLLDLRDEQIQGKQAFRIRNHNSHLILFRRKPGEDWSPEYRFDLEPHVYRDYEGMCLYHQTSPESHFTKGRLCSLATREGRITLTGQKLIVSNELAGVRTEQNVSGEDEYNELLRTRFGVVLQSARPA